MTKKPTKKQMKRLEFLIKDAKDQTIDSLPSRDRRKAESTVVLGDNVIVITDGKWYHTHMNCRSHNLHHYLHKQIDFKRIAEAMAWSKDDVALLWWNHQNGEAIDDLKWELQYAEQQLDKFGVQLNKTQKKTCQKKVDSAGWSMP